ncbi:MAG: MFS transporter [Asgard group archaeon]|nr:MFS transporter [Asgard group archaeon]
MFSNTKNQKVVPIILFRTLVGFNTRLIRYLVPLFLIFLEWNEYFYGLLFSVAGYLATGVIIGLGYITDVKKRKYTLIVGIGISALSMLLFYFSSVSEIKGWMIAAYSLFGVSGQLAQISLTTLMADVTPTKKEKTRFFGYMAFFWNVAGVIAPLLGGAFLTVFNLFQSQKQSYMSLMLFVSAFLFLTMLLAFKFPIPETSKEDASEIAKGEVWKSYENKNKKPIGFQLVAFFVCEAIIGFTSGIAIPFVQYYIITDFQTSDILWSVILAASNVGIALGSLLMVKISNRFGNEKSLAVLHFLVPLLALGISLGGTLWTVSIFFVTRSTAANMSRPAWNSFFYGWLPPKYRGTSTGFVGAGRRLARSLGTQAGSFIYVALGAWTFPIATLGYPIAIMIPIIMQLFLKNKEKESETAPILSSNGERI